MNYPAKIAGIGGRQASGLKIVDFTVCKEATYFRFLVVSPLSDTLWPKQRYDKSPVRYLGTPGPGDYSATHNTAREALVRESSRQQHFIDVASWVKD